MGNNNNSDSLTFRDPGKCTAMGRNGKMKVSGVAATCLPECRRVMIVPLTSRGVVGNCRIDIPVAEIPAFIEMLQQVSAIGPDADAQKYYLQTHGAQCPRCASIAMEGGMLDDDGDGYARRDVECVDCGAKWQDVFRLAKFIPKREDG